MTVAVHNADERRQRAVEALQVLDTPPDPRFDRITSLACTIFGVPVATISLIDKDRTWYKSCIGIPGITDLPRESTFCYQAVNADELTIVEDASTDPRFRDLPGVTEMGLRFYAGFPLRDHEGTTVGVFCIYDRRARGLDAREQAILASLAGWVEDELLSAHADDHARAIQRSLMPRSAPQIPGYTAAAICRPASAVAGDFFDHQNHGDRHAFAVADVMGKGAGAAILMATVRAVLRAELRALAAGRYGDRGNLGEAMTEVNTVLIEDLSSSGAFVTGFYGWADPISGSIRFVDAGHGMAVVMRADGTAEHLSSVDLPLGVTDAWRWTERRVVLEEGDDLVCFSDGLLDLMGGTLDAIPAIIQMIEGCSSAQEIVDRVDEMVMASGPLLDDVTVLVIRRDGAS